MSRPVPRLQRPGVAVLALTLLLAVLAPAAASAQPRDRRCSHAANVTYDRLLSCVSADSVMEHLEELQAIADANGGTRASGTPGYDASVDYIVEQLTAAGYEVTTQDFDFFYYDETAPSRFAQVTPTPTEYVEPDDFYTATYSGSGDVQAAPVVPVDINLDGDRANTSGCEPEDFADFPEGAVALVQRGTCPFGQKALNADAAGAAGVLIFNQGDDNPNDDRFGVVFATLGEPGVTIPVFGISFDLGVELATGEDVTVDMFAETIADERVATNVIAETPWGDPDNVVMVGAHLDSVPEGPGINDNGSGSAAVLDVALALRNARTPNKVRYAWWGAEEFGLLGSDEYVYGLSDEERDDIALYLNFDMVGSPNYVRFVYDGDGDAFGLEGPEGSAEIEQFFLDYYGLLGLASEPTEIDFRSDYSAFFDFDIPFGGLFTGAEGEKTPEQAAVYGGTAGEWYDPCYHMACDTIGNIAHDVLDVNVDAIAAAVLTYAFSTEDVNGVPGRKVPGRPLERVAPNPRAGVGGGSGGGHLLPAGA